MINFETRYDETTERWQYRAPGGEWSQPIRSGKLAQMLQAEVQVPKVQTNSVKGTEFWSKPLDPAARDAQRIAEQTSLYEIKGGKVQRIAATAKERTQQQMDELLAILELGESK